MRRLKLVRSPYHHYLEEDGNFRSWVEALERGSILTASVYFCKTCYACEQLGTTHRRSSRWTPSGPSSYSTTLIGHFETKGSVAFTKNEA